MTAPLSNELKKNLHQVANAIRQLTIDAVQQADSGHPGLPLGCAEILATKTTGIRRADGTPLNLALPGTSIAILGITIVTLFAKLCIERPVSASGRNNAVRTT